MMNNSADRVIHSVICLGVFLGWYSCFYLVAMIPGYAALYRSGLAMAFVPIFILVPFAVAAWSLYARRYPFLTLGRFSAQGFWLPALALVVLTFIHGYFAQPETWLSELPQQTASVKWPVILAISVFAPVYEEIIFRGFVLNSSIGWGRYAKTAGIIATSGLFALTHIQYAAISTFIYLFIFSAILCTVRINNRGLIVPMVLHIINNSWASFVMFHFS
ncbi:CPBP family intramembrane metalloprotease [Superficieibacter electus]|uniref:CPBP family intramembrane metalloprotease n=1 Tax=Superficieibacter electus TaxID=2022662 RepID=A0A2P5GI03_9ENTR|nr:type II CAAX endopeptidase family protein [Superficieibacter electus]POP42424.1 CPBP family intramembrane metalloprotease [Superficieibacter electus]POP47956.1 CPBP family intramembrane metalloprotease [Superficieibacter electus]